MCHSELKSQKEIFKTNILCQELIMVLFSQLEFNLFSYL